MDARALLQLQSEWGADEFLHHTAQDRRVAARQPAPPLARLTPPPRAAGVDPAACGDLAALGVALQAFTGCALRETASHTVLGAGPAHAPVMLIGDTPGADEDRAGRPFIGLAGQLLERMLASIGLRRDDVRLSHVVPWRPPGDRPPSETEIAACLPFLRREIALVMPRTLVPLGAIAARAMLGESARRASIGRLRGVWTTVQVPDAAPIPTLPSYHPLYLIRTPAAKAQAWADLISLKSRLETEV